MTARLVLLGLVLGTLHGCATQVAASGESGVAIQVGVTESDPARKAEPIAQAHCARFGKKAELQSVREQVIFQYACR